MGLAYFVEPLDDQWSALDTAGAVVFVLHHGGLSAFEPLVEMVGDGVGVELEALSNEARLAPFTVHADNQEFRTVFIAQGWIIHRVLNITNVGLGEIDTGHGLCPLEDGQRLQFSSLFCHKS